MFAADKARTPLDPDAKAWPCGLIAKTIFNDTYSIHKPGTTGLGQEIKVTSDGIAWPSDKEHKYKNRDLKI